MKKLLLLVALIAAAGVAAWRSGFFAADSDPEPATVAVGTLSAPMVDGRRLAGAIHADLVLVTRDSAATADLEDRLPLVRTRLRDALDDYGRTAVMPGQPVDTRQLAAHLTKAVKAAFPAVRQVLVERASARPA